MKLPRKTYSALFHLLFCSALTGWEERNPGTHIYAHPPRHALCAHIHLTAKMSNRRPASLSLSFCRTRRVRWEALYVGKNSSSRVILVHVINRAFQCTAPIPRTLNRVVQTSIPLNGPWNLKLFSTSLQSIGKSIACELLRTLWNK